MTDTAYVTDGETIDPFAVIPPTVTPGNPIEAEWGNEVSVALADHEAQIAALIPTGTIMAFGGGTAPLGKWALCDGTERSSTDPNYAKLFSVIGYNYGQNGTNFKLPDFRARVPAGVNPGDAAFASPGTANPLAQRDLPLIRHTHGMKNHTHYMEIAQEGEHKHYVPGAGVGANAGANGQIYGTRGDPDAWPVYQAGIGPGDVGVVFAGSSYMVTAPPNRPISLMPKGWMMQGITINIPAQWSYNAREQGGYYHGHGVARFDGPSDNTTTEAGTAASASNANLPPYLTVNFIIRL